MIGQFMPFRQSCFFVLVVACELIHRYIVTLLTTGMDPERTHKLQLRKAPGCLCHSSKGQLEPGEPTKASSHIASEVNIRLT